MGSQPAELSDLRTTMSLPFGLEATMIKPLSGTGASGCEFLSIKSFTPNKGP